MRGLLSQKVLDRKLLAEAIKLSEELAILRTMLDERQKKDEALAMERQKTDEARAMERQRRDEAEAMERQRRDETEALLSELFAVRQSLTEVTMILRKNKLDYLRLRGAVDVRSAMGESDMI
jgi:hypothetical protein